MLYTDIGSMYLLEMDLSGPFPYTYWDDFLDPLMAIKAERAISQMPDSSWKLYGHYNEQIRGTVGIEQLPPEVLELVRVFHSTNFIENLSLLTGFNLIADKALYGGGLMLAGKDQFMNLHTDYLSHPVQKTWRRRLNLLYYLNSEWPEHWEGALELRQKEGQKLKAKIYPKFNRCLIFNTKENTLHGYPEPLKCPKGETRKVLSIWYYTDEKTFQKFTPTTYYQLTSASAQKKTFTWGDNQLIHLYWLAKRYLGINDDLADGLFRFMERLSLKRFLKNFASPKK